MFEFINVFVEALDEFFHNVVCFVRILTKQCEQDISFNLERVHLILDEIVENGEVVEHSKFRALEIVKTI